MISLLEQSLNFLQYFAICAVAFYLLGLMFRRAHDQPLFNQHSLIDFTYGLVNELVNLTLILWLTGLTTHYLLDPWFKAQPLASLLNSLPFPLQLLLALFLFDSFQYGRHRFSHRFLWKFHACHHSAKELRWSTHFRFHPLELVLNNLLFSIFLYFIGFDLTNIWWVNLIALANNMYLHANIDLRFPTWLQYIITCPNYHKWHHADCREAIDRNFADIFPILDILFGTFYYPEAGKKLPDSYGLYNLKGKSPYYTSYVRQLLYPFRSS